MGLAVTAISCDSLIGRLKILFIIMQFLRLYYGLSL